MCAQTIDDLGSFDDLSRALAPAGASTSTRTRSLTDADCEGAYVVTEDNLDGALAVGPPAGSMQAMV